jgi:hypothetical protein
MNARRTWVPLGLMLLAGIALGVLGMAVWIHAQLRAFHSEAPEEVAVRVLDRELDLAPGQEKRARVILHHAHERLADFHAVHADELHGILLEAARQLEALLRPEQTVVWKSMHEQMVNHLLASGFLGRHFPGEHGEPPEGR